MDTENNYSYQDMDAIEQMRMRPISWVNLCIVCINIVIFLLVEFTGSSLDTMHMLNWGAAYSPFILEGKEYYRLFTSMFLHFGIQHLFNNMILLFFLGDILERTVGKLRYLVIYILGGLGGGVLSLLWSIRTDSSAVSAGASGAIFAVIGAMIYILIVNRGRLENLTTRRLVIMAGLTLYVGFTSGGVDNAAHIGGLLGGLILSMLVYRKRNASY